jgi:hypothetical protein
MYDETRVGSWSGRSALACARTERPSAENAYQALECDYDVVLVYIKILLEVMWI